MISSDDRAAGGGEAFDPSGKDLQVRHAGADESLTGLVGADPGLADEDDFAVEAGGEGSGVLTDELEGQVVGAGDVAGLELRGAADVEDGDRVRLTHPVQNGDRVNLSRGSGGHGISP